MQEIGEQRGMRYSEEERQRGKREIGDGQSKEKHEEMRQEKRYRKKDTARW